MEEKEKERSDLVVQDSQEDSLLPTTNRKLGYILKSIKAIKTPSSYVSLKDKYPYVHSNYVDDLFSKIFPDYEVEIIDKQILQNYWIYVIVRVTVKVGDKTISRIGAGASRLQITREARAKVESGQGIVTPLDYVDIGNDIKAAITKAIKNAQERFGIAADINDRIVLSQEEIDLLEERFKELADSIVDIRVKSQLVLGWKNCKTVKEKLEFLNREEEKYK